MVKTTPKKVLSRMDKFIAIPEYKPGIIKVKREFAADCDIANIVNRFLKTGQLPDSGRTPNYGDITSVSFLDMNNAVVAARTRFNSLPASFREELNNDPYQMLRFVEDPTNRARAEKYGLLKPKPTPETQTGLKADSESNPDKKPPEGP